MIPLINKLAEKEGKALKRAEIRAQGNHCHQGQ